MMDKEDLIKRIDPNSICPVIADFACLFYERTGISEFADWLDEFMPHLEGSRVDQQLMELRLKMAMAWIAKEPEEWAVKRREVATQIYNSFGKSNMRENVVSLDKKISHLDHDFSLRAQELIKQLLLVRPEGNTLN